MFHAMRKGRYKGDGKYLWSIYRKRNISLYCRMMLYILMSIMRMLKMCSDGLWRG